MSKIRTRIAPSPTGNLHLGTARSALFNYLFAKANKGEFILRIEDTDLERSDDKFTKDIIDGLKWLGIDWDEEITYQRKRLAIYQKYIKQLLDENKAYYCFCTKEELEQERQAQEKRGEATKYNGKCANLSTEKTNKLLKEKKKCIIRLKSSNKKIVFDDLIRNNVEFDTQIIGDIAIAKDLNTPLYNFAVVIDDAEMKISHIIRGEDHISNTPKQIMIQEALGLPQAKYAHLPLILGPDKSKLSKRHGATSVNVYREEGYLPEAMVNFMAFLGWNPKTDREIFSMKEFVDNFSLKKIQKGGAVFNIEKLDWMNSQYIRQMPVDNFAKACLPYLEKSLFGKGGKGDFSFEFIKKAVSLEQSRIKKLSEISEAVKFMFTDELKYDANILIWKKSDKKNTKENLEKIKEVFVKGGNTEKKIITLAKQYGNGDILWPMRVALSGKEKSPGPIEIAKALGKEKTLRRINRAINKLVSSI